MKATGGKSPKTPPSVHIHPEARDEILSSMSTIESSSRNDQAELKASCLRREGYRCGISGSIDLKSKHLLPGSGGSFTVRTQCAHILPFSLRRFDEQSAQEVSRVLSCYGSCLRALTNLSLNQTENKSTIWWALYRYFPDLKDLIDPSTINQPGNAITMTNALHEEFGAFNLALEPLGDVDIYPIRLSFKEISITLIEQIPNSLDTVSMGCPGISASRCYHLDLKWHFGATAQP